MMEKTSCTGQPNNWRGGEQGIASVRKRVNREKEKSKREGG